VRKDENPNGKNQKHQRSDLCGRQETDPFGAETEQTAITGGQHERANENYGRETEKSRHSVPGRVRLEKPKRTEPNK
jgi:hypothetical protein